MLQHTLDRMQRLVPPERTLIVVGAHQSAEAARQLAHWPQQNIIYQPANRDTAPGILLPFSYITHWDPSATIIVSPSDHFVRDENRFMEAVGTAIADLKRHRDKMILLGMTPEQGQETEYGYIQLKKNWRATFTRPVAGFVEKPPLALARRLINEGALWNTMVFTVRSSTLWADGPGHCAITLQRLWLDSVDVRSHPAPRLSSISIRRFQQTLPNVNFSSDICAPMAKKLRVLKVPNVGWSDWGTASSILRSLIEMGQLEAFRMRLEESQVHPSWYAASLG
jgi:mannose-1-phosphate guanylyltransferase